MRKQDSRIEKRKAKIGDRTKTRWCCHDPSTTRPDAPNYGAKEKIGRSGRDDSWRCCQRKGEFAGVESGLLD